jgi:ribonuclease T1
MQSRYLRILGSILALLLALVVALLSARDRVGTGPTPANARPTTALAVAAATARATPTPTPRHTDPIATPTAPAQNSRPTLTSTPRVQAALPTPNDGLPTIDFARLPPEARQTILLIDQGGPFPFDRDGIVFGNRERLLPLRADGYYHEYTVITPGSDDRGARRIIVGQAGELYYTDDHYESFKRVRR